MITPNIRYYARLEFDPSTKTPKYKVVAQAGYYEPMEQLRGKDGQIAMYLQGKLKEGENVPSMRLQARRSLNFTGLKEYFKDGRLSGYAYGEPYGKETYSKAKKPNPFYRYKEDGYLFIVHQDQTAQTEAERIRPKAIELVVLEGAKVLIAAYCKQLVMGGFNEALTLLRKQAVNV